MDAAEAVEDLCLLPAIAEPVEKVEVLLEAGEGALRPILGCAPESRRRSGPQPPRTVEAERDFARERDAPDSFSLRRCSLSASKALPATRGPRPHAPAASSHARAGAKSSGGPGRRSLAQASSSMARQIRVSAVQERSSKGLPSSSSALGDREAPLAFAIRPCPERPPVPLGSSAPGPRASGARSARKERIRSAGHSVPSNRPLPRPDGPAETRPAVPVTKPAVPHRRLRPALRAAPHRREARPSGPRSMLCCSTTTATTVPCLHPHPPPMRLPRRDRTLAGLSQGQGFFGFLRLGVDAGTQRKESMKAAAPRRPRLRTDDTLEAMLVFYEHSLTKLSLTDRPTFPRRRCWSPCRLARARPRRPRTSRGSPACRRHTFRYIPYDRSVCRVAPA